MGVTGILGVKGFAAGFKVYFFGAFCCFSDEVDSLLVLPGVCCCNEKMKFIIYVTFFFSLISYINIVFTGVDVAGGVLLDELLALDVCCCNVCETGDWYS